MTAVEVANFRALAAQTIAAEIKTAMREHGNSLQADDPAIPQLSARAARTIVSIICGAYELAERQANIDRANAKKRGMSYGIAAKRRKKG